MTTDPVVAARALREIIEAGADQAERDRRLPTATVEALRDAGLMRLCVGAAYGGPETMPTTMVETLEAVAIADGAAGWCAMIASTTSSLSVFLEPAWAQRIYGDPATITGGAYAPNGSGVTATDGYRVTGRWMWGSGTHNCQWIVGGTLTDDGGFHVMFFDPADVTIHDTWHSSGLRGTGSNDFSVDAAFVPAGRSVQPLGARPTIDSPLSRFPNFTLLSIGVAAVALGIGRRAIDELVALGQGKVPQFASRTLADSGWVQAEIAKADAGLRAARAFLLSEVHDAWQTVLRGDTVDVPTRARIRLAGVHAAACAASAADVAFTLGGGSAVFESSLLQRCLRDAHVATQHIMVAPRLYETAGKAIFGRDVDATML